LQRAKAEPSSNQLAETSTLFAKLHNGQMDVRKDAPEASLYKRIGGYDVIAAVIDDVFAFMRADPRFARSAQDVASNRAGEVSN